MPFPLSQNQRKLINAYRIWFPALTRDMPYPANSTEASRFIETVKIEVLNRYGGKHTVTNRTLCADRLVSNGLNVRTTFSAITPELGILMGEGTYLTSIEFKANVNGSRIAKPLSEQKTELWKLLNRLADELKRREQTWETREETQETTEPPSETDNSSDDVPPTDPPPSDEKSAESKSRVHPFLAKVREIRAEEMRRSELEGRRSPILEAVSGNRPAKNGKKMLNQGIPTEALLHALALDWPKEARDRYGIRDYDVTNFKNGDIPDGRHPAYAYARKAVDARIPIAAIGPSGTGKSTLFKQIAEDMGLSYGMVPMTAGATPGWLVGAYTLNGYVTRSAIECYRNGGIFVFEEMDSADPNMLLVANNLIENDVFINPVNNEELHRSKDYIPVACMNTKGTGATATNTGRNRLDDATRNRFAIGRFELMLSEELETFIFDNA